MENKLPWEENNNQSALWFLGQAGYIIKSDGVTIIIDPYLSDCVSKVAPLFARTYPVPVDPGRIKADIFIVTHDHLDHLDPDTITSYAYKSSTVFVSPRHAAKKLKTLGIPPENIVIVDHGDTAEIKGISIKGVFALATGPDVVDTTGYAITFSNGKSVYHTSDTAYCDLLLKACPKADVLLPCINGKFGNLNIAQAIELTHAVDPKYVIPNHYDVMALNSENPEAFRYACVEAGIGSECLILNLLENFVWE